MKALIFNSGLGSRLGELTSSSPKCMVKLKNGESIFRRQLRILRWCGITEFVVTTGPFADQLVSVAREFEQLGCSFTFVRNEKYDQTNYIYSMYLARDYLRGDDFLMIHGDLVFDVDYVRAVLNASETCLGSVNKSLPQPEKDFKARIVSGMVKQVGVNIFDEDCFAFQPFYKLNRAAFGVWIDAVERFVDAGVVSVYAENAANEVFDRMGVAAFSYEGHVVEEIDTPDDLARVSALVQQIDYDQQPVFMAEGQQLALLRGCFTEGRLTWRDLLNGFKVKRPLVVTGSHFDSFGVKVALDELEIPFVLFQGFSSNPDIESAREGMRAYLEHECDALISVGGGSAIDTAKCIKAALSLGSDWDVESLAKSSLPFCGIPHIAVPTTAGTGSESTHFAVCYRSGTKISVSHDCLLPDVAVLDASNLHGLPDYQRKSAYLDALAQAIESHWSRKSCDASRTYSACAMRELVEGAGYCEGDEYVAPAVLCAANAAGKAINVTTTTVAHAMSYKLTSLFGLSHGHAVALCLPFAWRMALQRGDAFVQERLSEIALAMTGDSCPQKGLEAFSRIVESCGLQAMVKGTEAQLAELVAGVNPERLGNFPVDLSRVDIEAAYREILSF